MVGSHILLSCRNLQSLAAVQNQLVAMFDILHGVCSAYGYQSAKQYMELAQRCNTYYAVATGNVYVEIQDVLMDRSMNHLHSDAHRVQCSSD